MLVEEVIPCWSVEESRSHIMVMTRYSSAEVATSEVPRYSNLAGFGTCLLPPSYHKLSGTLIEKKVSSVESTALNLHQR
jgi:hypothetical protein